MDISCGTVRYSQTHFSWKYLKAENELDRHMLTDAIARNGQSEKERESI